MEFSAEVDGVSVTWITLRRCDGCGLCSLRMGDRVENRVLVLLKKGTRRALSFSVCTEPGWRPQDVRSILEHVKFALACPQDIDALRSDETEGYVRPSLGRATISLAKDALRFLPSGQWERIFQMVEAEEPVVRLSGPIWPPASDDRYAKGITREEIAASHHR